ncbi:hypothetical protein [Moorena sp. SIO1G6]|nr:hypothetical protein [Moorena sp. SIO1G6]
MVSGQRSVVSGQQSVVSGQRSVVSLFYSKAPIALRALAVRVACA